jgi:hypothetical protein
VSYVARSNLMQVAQILQVLALWKWEEIDERQMDLYSRFDKDVMSSVLEAMLEAGETFDSDSIDMSDAASSTSDGGFSGSLSRLAVLMTRGQLEAVVGFFRNLRDSSSPDVDVTELSSLIDPLPEVVPGGTASSSTGGMGSSINKSASMGSTKSDDSSNSGGHGDGANHKTKKQVLASKLSNVASTVSNVSRGAVAKVGQQHDSTDSAASGDNNATTESNLMPCETETVLVIPLLDGGCSTEPPGFLSEEHVLTRSRQQQANRVVRMNLANLPSSSSKGSGGGGGGGGNEEAGEKRTRFSISHDEGSIGNASDNLEAISEAASNHSVDSSLEDEVDQAGDEDDPIIDNMSDMVSANVSGRGTPNVSGRDTPSSQVTEGDELVGRGVAEGIGGDEEGNRGAIHQLLSIILKLRILVLLPVSNLPYVVIV